MRRLRKSLTSPLLPNGIEILVQPPSYDACTSVDKILVYASSLLVVGSPFWFYGGVVYLYRRWKHYCTLVSLFKNTNVNVDVDKGSNTSSGESSQERPDTRQYECYKKNASCYLAALLSLLVLSLWGPHRSERFGRWLGVREWRLWDAWLNYVGFTVLRDEGEDRGHEARPHRNHRDFNIQKDPAIFAFTPHGVFPFGLAFSCLPRWGFVTTWGPFRPVVATATKFFPLVRTFIEWMGGVDASRNIVSSALHAADGASDSHLRRLGISPGGIAEMFETYPKPGFHRNDEGALIKHRNGIFKLACRHRVPIVPVYCFGATKMFRRVQLPHFIETLSRSLKISLCILFGKLGLPIPFRQRLTYVIGKVIWPTISDVDIGDVPGKELDRRAQEMHDAFCAEMIRIFDRNKTHYGWENKTLRLV